MDPPLRQAVQRDPRCHSKARNPIPQSLWTVAQGVSRLESQSAELSGRLLVVLAM